LEVRAVNEKRGKKMILKLFTQPSCPRCPAAKAVVMQIEHKVKVENYDIKTADGLAEALGYNIMTTPSIVIVDHDNNVLGEFLGRAPTVEELNKILG
jgi:glutaredoxin